MTRRFDRSLSLLFLFFLNSLFLQGAAASEALVTFEAARGSLPLVVDDAAATLYVDADDHPGVMRVAGHLQADLERVTGVRPALSNAAPDGEVAVIVGTLGKSDLVDTLLEQGKIDTSGVAGEWDAYAWQTVEDPFPDLERALVIFGADKRGTIYGVYELARQAGVSPWYWWADVPVQERAALYVTPGRHAPGAPKVKYRGIFINDEAPALRNWAEETFGGFNSEFYEKVYELILRNRGNFLWPAMWRPSAFAVDDPENARLADEYGVIVSTSHHEPMMRAHDEWHHADNGAWNYERNGERLRAFWKGGIERMGEYESLVTLGMRGDGDEAMSEDTAIGLMQRIIADQRDIIAGVTGRPAEETPQVWALYKEMQDYWDKGMRVPDDVLVLLCDDNWGNIRILPGAEDRAHPGGFGIYYHFDFVGGPVSYRWLNVTQIEKVWEQMNLSWTWGARDLWLVNVGDIKPMELPISFFLDMAWDPEAIGADDLPAYYVDWATEQFGAEFAADIAGILAPATKYAFRRTPEMLTPETWSLANYREAERNLEEHEALLELARQVGQRLPDSHAPAYFQLVLFPIEVRANLEAMYVAAGRNRLHAAQGRPTANYWANETERLFERDAELTQQYHEIESGKWRHMMSQTHIGYTSWNNPPADTMPAVSRVQVARPAGLGVAVEQDEAAYTPGSGAQPALPVFDPVNDPTRFIEVFNTGGGSLAFHATANQRWIRLSPAKGSVRFDQRLEVAIDWAAAPAKDAEGEVLITGASERIVVRVPIRRQLPPLAGFVENNGVVSFDASGFAKAVDAEGVSWTVVPNLGRTGSSVTVLPANAARREPGRDAPMLEYTFSVFEPGTLTVEAQLAPTLNYKKDDGLKYAIAIDDAPPQVVNFHEGETVPDWEYPEWWNVSVTDRVRKSRTEHRVDEPGPHTLRVWMIDPGVVFQHFVIDTGGLKESYLPPPPSKLATD